MQVYYAGDTTVQPEQVRKVIICSGKHYYNLAEERAKRQAYDTAIVRLESLSPFPVQELQAQLAQYGSVQCKFLVVKFHETALPKLTFQSSFCTAYVWSQEEHRNMGAWTFVQPRFENLIGKKVRCNPPPKHTQPYSTWHDMFNPTQKP